MILRGIVVISMLLLVLQNAECQTEDILRIGNALKPSASGVDVEGAIFLLNDMVLSDGILFAFSAFFRADTPVRLQIWRPEEEAQPGATVPGLYQLRGEIRVIPSVIEAREDIYIESRLTEPCIHVQEGDRLGVYFEEAPSAVAYTFDESDPNALGTTVSVPTEIGEQTRFNKLVFPYDFSLAAYFHANMSQYTIPNDTQFLDCPTGMLIPSFDPITLPQTTVTPPTGRPGDTGATGPMGPGGIQGAIGPDGQQGATGFGATGATGEMGPMGEQGVTGEIGAAGPQGVTGAPGSMGATGPQGEQGEKGDEGERGPPGPTVRVFVRNATDLRAEAVEDNEGESVISWILLVWLIIVTLLLVILIIILCCAWRRYRRDRREEKHAHAYMHSEAGYGNDAFDSVETRGGNGGDKSKKDGVKYTTRVPSYLEGQPTWTNTMKSIAESTYSIDTIGSQHSMSGNEQQSSTGNSNNLAVDTNVSDNNSHTGLMGSSTASPPLPQNERHDSVNSQESIDSKFAI